MTITIERGTESTASAVDFTGTVNLRRVNVRKDVAEAATKELTRAIGGNTFDAMRLGSILSGQLGISEAFSTSDFKYAALRSSTPRCSGSTPNCRPSGSSTPT